MPVRRFSCLSGPPAAPARLQPAHRAGRAYRYSSAAALLIARPAPRGLRPGGNDPIRWPSGVTHPGTAFTERPGHLDPVQSYSEDEASFPVPDRRAAAAVPTYLEAPLCPEPATAEAMPSLVPVSTLAAASRLRTPTRPRWYRGRGAHRPGILYQPHPAFALDEDGSPRYLGLGEADLRAVRVSATSPRPARASSSGRRYVYQIKRLAHPRLHSPIFELMAEYLPGPRSCGRAGCGNRKAGGRVAAAKEDDPPGWLDLDRFAPPRRGRSWTGHTLRITLQGAYPQFLYFPALLSARCRARLTASSPSLGMAERNLTLDWWAHGHRAVPMLVENNPNAHGACAQPQLPRRRLSLRRRNPATPRPGCSATAANSMPFIDKVVFAARSEGIPAWNKFPAGILRRLRVSSDNFDQAVRWARAR